MATNDETIPIEDALKEIRDGVYLKSDSWANEEVAKIVEMYYKKARSDTAKRIFDKLDAVAWQQIEPAKLEQFYKEFSEAKDEKAALEIAKKYSIIGFSAEKYDAVKKKYKVD